MPKAQVIDTSMGEKAKRLPPSPRIVINGYVILPLVDSEWQPVQDMWVLPGRRVLTTQEVRDLADARGLAFDLIN
jgi:hypothetical protein